MLTEEEINTLNQLERVSLKWEYQARHLRDLVQQCREQQDTKGIAEMVAFTFNAQQFTPRYGGGGEQLPPGDYVGVVVNAEPVNTTDQQGQVKGGYLALTLTPTEGPLTGQKHIDRLNLHNSNPKTVEIANEQMSAYCHVLNQFNIADTQQLCNIPFRFTIGWQRGQEPSQERPSGGYTEVKAIYDINGNPPGKAGAGPQSTPQQQQQQFTPPPAGVTPQSAAPPPSGQWGGAPAQQPQQQPAQGQPPASGGWGQQPPQTAPQQAPAAPQGQWGGAPANQPAQQGAAPWGGPQQ